MPRPKLSRRSPIPAHAETGLDCGSGPTHFPEGARWRSWDARHPEAGTGTECLKAADKTGPFDLILLDVNLPDMDGYAICRALRHVDKKVPIVFVTAKGDLKDYTAGREAGGDSYLVKPIARAALRSIVNLFTSIERSKRPDHVPMTKE